MPTGYTCIIEDGNGCTFEEYVWRCARGMGAMIMMRDSSLDAPVTDEAVVAGSDYYHEDQVKNEKRLAELAAMTEAEADRCAQEAYEKDCKTRADVIAKREETSRRYATMRRKAEEWTPPTPEHEGLKRFMLEQIALCVRDGHFEWPVPERLSAAQWLAQEKSECARQLRYTREHLDKQDAFDRSRLAWVRALRESVPQPGPRK